MEYKSSYGKCINCGEWEFLDGHRCLPEWDAFLFDYGSEEDHGVTHASNAEDAALNYATNGFSDWDYPNDMIICVKRPSEAEWQKFNITVEAVPHFSASKLR